MTPEAIIIREATENDVPHIILLLDEFYPGGHGHWSKLFKHASSHIRKCPGFIIVAGEMIVGFLGTLISQHSVREEIINLCNLTSWYVKPAFRQYSMVLFAKVMRLPNMHFTNLTPAPHLYPWLIKTGFQILEDKQTLFLPLPNFKKKFVEIKTNFLKSDLPQLYQDIYERHQNTVCIHILIKGEEQNCYCIAIKSSFKKIPCAKIYFISNKPFFEKVIKNIRFRLCRLLKIGFFTIEGVMENVPFLSFTIKLNNPRLYKSSYLLKSDFSLLDSELLMLGI